MITEQQYLEAKQLVADYELLVQEYQLKRYGKIYKALKIFIEAKVDTAMNCSPEKRVFALPLFCIAPKGFSFL